MKATIRGTEIYFDVFGMQIAPVKKAFVEKPVLFMLHGGPGGNHLSYKRHSLGLEDVAQLVFIDHRGCGLSKKTKASEYTLENNIEDIEALRQYLGLERISILGSSYGGIVAQGYAIRYPNQVEKLILSATAPSHRFLDEAKAYLEAHGTPRQKAIAEHLWNGTFKDSEHVEDYFKKMEPLYSYLAKHKKKRILSSPGMVWSHEALNQGFSESLREFDFIAKLKKIVCPTLVLAGEKDWICSPDQAKIIADNVPDAELKVFKQAAHTIANDVQKKYVKAVKQFLLEVPSSKKVKVKKKKSVKPVKVKSVKVKPVKVKPVKVKQVKEVKQVKSVKSVKNKK